MTDENVARIISGSQVKALPSRKITQDTAAKFDYRVFRNIHGEIEHVAVYRDELGQATGVKLRNTGTPEKPKKDFVIVGDVGDRFFGQHLWPAGGRRLVIVGGEIDALTYAGATDNQWPVVSPPKGEKGLLKALKANWDWVCSFKEVCLGLDMDAVGREANLEAAAILPPGKAKIVEWTKKDPNEMLLAGEGKQIFFCVHNAQPFQPGGIINVNDVSDVRPEMGIPWPWRAMTNWTLGRRPGEVYVLGGGTGLGKSDTLYETVVATIMGKTREGDNFEKEGFAMFCYEAGPARIRLEILSKIAQRRFKIPQGHPKCMWTEAELEEAKRVLREECAPLWLMDSKGVPDWDRSKDVCRFLNAAHDIKHFAWDPLSAMVAGEDDERKLLDGIIMESQNLSVEVASSLYFYSHLTGPRGDNLGHENGARVQLNQFRGSNAIGMFAAFVMGYERDTSADTPEERCIATLRMVKDRLLGDSTGETFKLHYDRLTGTLDMAVEEVPEEAEGYELSEEDKELI